MNESLSGMAGALFQQLQGAPVQQMSAQLGTDPQQIQSAIGTALPLLLGALGRNTQQPQGAEALLGALQRDHAPAAAGNGFDLGDLLGSVLGGGTQAASPQTDGAGILGHVFGNSAPTAAAGLGQATGLGGDKAGQLLQMLAPIVLSFLAQRFLGGGNGGGAADPTQLSQALGQEHAQAQASGIGDLLGGALDQDGDGQFGVGDLLKIGGGLFGRP
jgi:hypothetical protein